MGSHDQRAVQAPALRRSLAERRNSAAYQAWQIQAETSRALVSEAPLSASVRHRRINNSAPASASGLVSASGKRKHNSRADFGAPTAPVTLSSGTWAIKMVTSRGNAFYPNLEVNFVQTGRPASRKR